MSAPAVVGLDLSITATGVASGDVDNRSTFTAISMQSGDERLDDLTENIVMACAEFRYLDFGAAQPADLVVIEGPVLRSQAALILGMLHGAVRVDLIRRKIPYAIVPPATLKKFATGKGNASKAEMAVALYKRTGMEMGGDDNQVDAWWLFAAGMQHLGSPVVDLPAAQIAALDKVVWPGRTPGGDA